jgi:hypothetical protein
MVRPEKATKNKNVPPLARQDEDEEGDIKMYEFDALVDMIEDKMDTRSEKCRRWLVANSLVREQEEDPVKFLQRLRRTIGGFGFRFKQAVENLRG